MEAPADRARAEARVAHDDRRPDLLAALGWFLVAAAVRAIGLGRWSLWGDEIFSLENAEQMFTPKMSAGDLAFPLFYLLERGALEVAGFLGADLTEPATLQLVARIVPALAGTLAVVAAFVSSRGVLRRTERHALAALVAFSPWFLFFSQLARFYAVALALCVPASLALLKALRDGDRRAAWRGVAWSALASLTHPTAALLLFGHLAAVFLAALLRVRPLNRAIVPPLLLPLVMALPAAIWPKAVIDTVVYKLGAHDAGIEGAASLVLGIGWNFGPVIGALALLGLPVLWRRDRAVGLHVIVGVGLPGALMLALAALGKSVEQRYLIGIVPLALLPAAAVVGELAERLAPALRGACVAVPCAALAAWVPGVVSEAIDGNRPDFAAALAYVAERLEPGDGVICESHALARRYLPARLPDDRLLEAEPPGEDGAQYDAMWKECARLWVVVPADFEEKSRITRSFQRWAWQEGRLAREFWQPRLDYHQNQIRVFRIDPKRAKRWYRPSTPR